MKVKNANRTAKRGGLVLIATSLGLVITIFAATAGERSLLRVEAQQTTVTLVNAASYAGDASAGVTPDSIGALFGQFVTQGNQTFAATPNQPLPTQLGGVSVTIGGRPAPLFFVSRLQINLAVPADLADGTNAIAVTNSDNTTRSGTVKIVRSEPGIFSAKSDGKGNAAALTTRDGRTFTTTFNPDGSEKPVDAGTKQQLNYLVLFGTGIRTTPATNPNDTNGVAESIVVTLQGVPVPVLYAGPAPGFVGLDQINVQLPPEISGFGTVDVKVSTPARGANGVSIRIGGELTPVNLRQITVGTDVSGELTVDDQVQAGGANTYFFDAYVFSTTTPNTTVAVDLRSGRFDAAVLLFRLENGALTQVAQDDQTGVYGTPSFIKSFDALLVTVLPAPGQYAIFATSSDFQPNGTGAYTLRLSTNVAQQVSYGANISGQIATSDYRNSSGTLLDFYWFSGTAGDNVQIDLSSSAFDSYLILNSQQGDPPLTTNDNINDTTKNSRITYRLPVTGNYIIIATPFEPNTTGAYTLTLNRAAAGMATDGPPPLGLEALPTGRELTGMRPRALLLSRPATGRHLQIEP